MTDQASQNMSTWTVREKAFGAAALICAAFALYFATVGGRWGAFGAGTFAFSISWWAARRARVKGE
jgi:hypothetical protein